MEYTFDNKKSHRVVRMDMNFLQLRILDSLRSTIQQNDIVFYH